MDSAARHAVALARRGLLRGATALSALAVLQPSHARSQAPGDPFALGVASGDPWPDGVVIWTRLAPDPMAAGGGMGPAAVEVAWEVAEDERMARTIQRGTFTATPALGHSVHVELRGLQPARTYFYRFRALGAESRVGRTRTAPEPGSEAPIRFLNAGCQNYEHGLFTAWRHAAAEEEIDFVFHYGDYIYEYRTRPGSRPLARTHHSVDVLTLEDYRARYAQYRLDPDLAAAHAAHPFVTSYDDHEIENNWAGLISQRHTPPEVFLLRCAAAFQAWYENSPVRAAALPRGVDITAYRRLRFGRTLDLHVLDTRRFRDDQPCGDGNISPCGEVARPNAQMLGPAQEEWLREGIARSGARWQILAQQVFLAPRPFPSGTLAMDTWDGYPAARARLLETLGGRDTVALTGDVHSAWANELSLRPGDRPVAVEFIGTSIASNGDGSPRVGYAEAIMAAHPHLRFNSNRRGYTLHVARADRVEAIYRAVPHVVRPDAPREDAGHFVTFAGRPGVVAA